MKPNKYALDYLADAITDLNATEDEKASLRFADWDLNGIDGPLSAGWAARERLSDLRWEIEENAKFEREYAQ